MKKLYSIGVIVCFLLSWTQPPVCAGKLDITIHDVTFIPKSLFFQKNETKPRTALSVTYKERNFIIFDYTGCFTFLMLYSLYCQQGNPKSEKQYEDAQYFAAITSNLFYLSGNDDVENLHEILRMNYWQHSYRDKKIYPNQLFEIFEKIVCKILWCKIVKNDQEKRVTILETKDKHALLWQQVREKDISMLRKNGHVISPIEKNLFDDILTHGLIVHGTYWNKLEKIVDVKLLEPLKHEQQRGCCFVGDLKKLTDQLKMGMEINKNL